jgi:hypothetical protein
MMRSAKALAFLALFCLLTAAGASAQKVTDVDLIVYENDTVVLYSMKVYDGKLRNFLESDRTEYVLKMVDAADRTTNEIVLPVGFYVMTDPPHRTEAVPVSVTMLYNDNWRDLQVYHNGSLIFQKSIEGYFCNGDSVCGPPEENAVSCPSDCPPGSADGWCQPFQDGACDPDCLSGLDPDCGQAWWPWAAAGAIIVIIMVGLALYLRRA